MDFLSQEEADELLQMLKRCLDKSLVLPVHGERADYNITSIVQKNENFIVSVNRTNSMVKKVSYIARYKKDNTVLLRLDVAPTAPHQNPERFGGNKIVGTHLHIYREGYESKYAIPFDLKDINLEKNFFEFLNQFNVIEQPTIIEQLKLGE